jgi:lysozyme
VFGIDVFEGDGRVDWAAVKNSGKTFAFVKATEGKSIKDKAFSHHWPVMKMDGIIRGAFHFFHPKTSDPTQQAHEFLNTIGKIEPGDLPPVLDVETTDGAGPATIVKAMKQWLIVVEKTIQQQTGKRIKPIIYTSPSFWNEQLGNPPDFADYPLWIAHYKVETPLIPSSFGKGNWLIHQYLADVQHVPGVERQAYLNKFNALQEGAANLRVKDIQQRLKDLEKPEFDPGDVNGIFNARTEAAVIAFQKFNNLQADGIVGPKTWVNLLWA